MHRSIWSFYIRPPGNPPIIWTFENWFVQIPVPFSQNCVQMPHQVPDLMETTTPCNQIRATEIVSTLNVLE